LREAIDNFHPDPRVVSTALLPPSTTSFYPNDVQIAKRFRHRRLGVRVAEFLGQVDQLFEVAGVAGEVVGVAATLDRFHGLFLRLEPSCDDGADLPVAFPPCRSPSRLQTVCGFRSSALPIRRSTTCKPPDYLPGYRRIDSAAFSPSCAAHRSMTSRSTACGSRLHFRRAWQIVRFGRSTSMVKTRHRHRRRFHWFSTCLD
jgi:hypothetical protein